MNKLNIAKKYFRKYGFSEKVLGEIVALLPNDENATEETILEQLQAYESIAQSFQNEIERRVSIIQKKYEQPNPEPADPKTEAGANNETLNLLKEMNQRLNAMEKGQISATLNNTAVERLKALQMNEKEIEAVMYGRNFETSEAVDDFVEKQSEYYKDIIATRTKDNAGNGFRPQSGASEYTKADIEQDIAEFNKQF